MTTDVTINDVSADWNTLRNSISDIRVLAASLSDSTSDLAKTDLTPEQGANLLRMKTKADAVRNILSAAYDTMNWGW